MSALGLVLAAQIAAGGQLIPTWTYADRVPGGGVLAELRVVQPVLFVSAEPFGGRLRLHAMLDGEGVTIENGQLATGDFGEGFIDKRHPHTWGHELIASAVDVVPLPLQLHWSLTAGKGFAPFGTDDPMNRPAIIYPVNHHWSQILERAVVIGGLSRGPVTVEGGVFNGDEPENPWQWPNWDRFGDSWSVRALVHPASWLELQASRASVKSPEHRPGAGLTHEKTSVSARYQRGVSLGELYGLAEWSYNNEGDVFFYHSALLEGQLQRGRHRPYLRFELTDRPEELRNVTDPFRTPRPHFENSNLGTSRWSTVTAGYGLGAGPRRWPARFEVIAEGSYLHVEKKGGGFFDPLTVWGRNDLWLASVAVRITAGSPLHRMGRYGVAAAGHSNHSHHDME